MAKIDFNKVEQNLHQAMHTMFVKNLVSGKQAARKRAVIYFGNHLAKPAKIDSVIEAINEWRVEQALAQTVQEVEKDPSTLAEHPLAKKDVFAPNETTAESEVPQEQYVVPPIYILRKHILWFVRKRVANIYKLLNTTKEEVLGFRRNKELNSSDNERIAEILARAQEINLRLMKKLGIDTDEALVEKEVIRHKTKRLNIRETWLPL